MFKKICAVVIAGILIQACSTVQSDLDVAKSTDNIATYKQFLSMHPDSEHTEWVERRIAELEEKDKQREEKKREKKRRENATRFSKLQSYKQQIGVLTEKQFLETDGWTLAKNDGRIGIVGVVKNKASSEFSLGMIQEVASDPGVDLKTAEWIKDAESAVNAAVMQGLKEGRDYSYQPPQDGYKVLCSLTFAQEGTTKERVLSGWHCEEDEIKEKGMGKN